MAITNNNTLPQEWNPATTYYYGDTVMWNNIIYKCIEGPSINNNPAIENTYWYAIEIYRKDATVMNHGQYSGDAEMWERDEIRIDSVTGEVYINGKDTGINVKGPAGSTSIKWADLTPEQREQLKGDKGDTGLTGPKGDKGDTGSVAWGELTPEQIEQLRGDQGLDAFETWKKQTGREDATFADYIQAITGPKSPVDAQLDFTSINPVQNKVIAEKLQTLEDLTLRIKALEDRLEYAITDPLNPDADEDGRVTYRFKFGVTHNGEFGYVDPSTGEVIPFNGQPIPVISTAYAETAYQILDGSFADTYSDTEKVDLYTLSNNDQHNQTTNLTNDDTDNVTYATGVKFMSMEDAFNAKFYIFRNGEFERYKASFNFYNMALHDNYMVSKGTESGEGCWTGTETGNYASTIHFVVEPTVEGQTVNCQYGTINTDNTALPLITTGTGRVSYQTGSFNTETTFSFEVKVGQGAYFASIVNQGDSPKKFIIKEIYMS